MSTPPLDLTALRKVAESATPGPWEAKQGAVAPGKKVVGPRESNDLGRGPIVLMQPIFWDKRSAANAAHIAAFDPPTVLALLDRVEAAEATIERVEDLAYTLLGEHGQSWNAISGRRVWSALHPPALDGSK